MNIQWRKLKLALSIMGIGMLIAIIWHGWQGWALGSAYPYNTFLFSPDARFSDFTDAIFISSLPNPYEDIMPYFPFACVLLRPLALLPWQVSVTGFLFLSLTCLVLPLNEALEKVVPHPVQRTVCVFLFIFLSYPVLICIDRGNLELVLACCAAGGIYCLSRGWYFPSLLGFIPAIAIKLYPAFLLLLLVRQRRFGPVILGIIIFLVVTLLSLKILSVSCQSYLHFYQRDLDFYTNSYIYENHAIEGSASLWNVFKIGVIAASQLGFVQSVDFTYDNPFVVVSYHIYLGAMLLLAALVVAYVCLVERDFLRCVATLLLYLALATPSGPDYRLLYVCIALVAVIMIRKSRACDQAVVLCLALVMIPKKEILLTFVGLTETNYPDVPVQTVLNPLLTFAALTLLLYDGWRQADLKWIRLRFIRLLRAAWPKRGHLRLPCFSNFMR